MKDLPDDPSYGYEFFYGSGTTNGFTMHIGRKVSKIPAGLTLQPSGNHGLTNIIFDPESVCESIGNAAFQINVRKSQLKSVSFSNNIKIIGTRAFYGNSSLPNITFPNSLESIGELAFAQCTTLSTINFDGTMEQWNNITKSSDWNENVPATVVHCSDGDVAL